MGEIRNVHWQEISTAVRNLVARWTAPDVVVGVSRGGVPIAIAVSYAAPMVPVAFATRVPMKGNNDPFYVFGGGSGQREERSLSEFRAPELSGSPRNILLIDDVATFGGTLSVITEMLLSSYPEASISYYCFAVDKSRLHNRRPAIAARTSSEIEIDNKAVWLQMPWQLQ